MSYSYDRRTAGREQPYVVRNKGKARVLYGPFPDQSSAQRASFFNHPVEDRDKYLDKPRMFPYGVESYDQTEIESLTETPGDYGLTKVEVKPPARLTMHPSWKPMLQPNGPDWWWANWTEGTV